MNPIRVLHTEWSDGWGGQEIRILNEMLAVRKRGVEVFLACRENARIREKALEQEIPVFTLPFRGNTDLRTLGGLIGIIRREKIDIVNTHSGKDTWVGGLSAKLTGRKFIRTRHLSNPINPSRLNFINEIADFVITTGSGVREDLIRNNRIKPERIASVPTGIDAELFDPSQYDRETERRKLGISDDEIAIGALGVIRRVKRHEDFIRAAAILNKKYGKLRFFIAGDGPIRKDHEALTTELKLDNFTFLGHTDRPAGYLSALDIFVNSSANEGVPQAVIQALMMRKAVVATDAGSTSDLYDDNFLLVDPLAPERLAEGIETLLTSKEKREAFSRKSREPMLSNFSDETMAERIVEIYRKVLQ